MRERSLSVDEEERRRVVSAGRDAEDGLAGDASERQKAVSILDILHPSKDDGSHVSTA